MEINWITLSAQVVNFLVLVWLLKHFLYGRIVKAMKEREEKITARLDEAMKLQGEARAEVTRYQEKNRAIDEQKEQVLARAREDAEAQRLELLHKARAEVADTQARWHEALRQEIEAAELDLRRQLSKRLLTALRKILQDLAHAELDQRMMEVFLQRLADLGPGEWRAFAEDLPETDGAVTVRTSHELPDPLRDQVAQIVRAKMGRDVPPRFETAPDLICGIELRVSSQRLAWSVENYLDELERGFVQALEEKAADTSHSRNPEEDRLRASLAPNPLS